MSMTRKDYILLAETLRLARSKDLGAYQSIFDAVKDSVFGTEEVNEYNERVINACKLSHQFIAVEMANALSKDNARFESERFLVAAGAR